MSGSTGYQQKGNGSCGKADNFSVRQKNENGARSSYLGQMPQPMAGMVSNLSGGNEGNVATDEPSMTYGIIIVGGVLLVAALAAFS